MQFKVTQEVKTIEVGYVEADSIEQVKLDYNRGVNEPNWKWIDADMKIKKIENIPGV